MSRHDTPHTFILDPNIQVYYSWCLASYCINLDLDNAISLTIEVTNTCLGHLERLRSFLEVVKSGGPATIKTGRSDSNTLKYVPGNGRLGEFEYRYHDSSLTLKLPEHFFKPALFALLSKMEEGGSDPDESF